LLYQQVHFVKKTFLMWIGERWVSLNALHTFEVAARHEHMRLAAEELHVTQSAVSHQVRTLESALGIQLFNRAKCRLTLTAEDCRLMPTVQQALGSIACVSLQLRQDEFSGTLNIATPRSFSHPVADAEAGRFPAPVSAT
jgi:DNA-binding transcriptional LysR family regulator